MEFHHKPVLFEETIRSSGHPARGNLYIDGTMGGGGHSEAICEAADHRAPALHRPGPRRHAAPPGSGWGLTPSPSGCGATSPRWGSWPGPRGWTRWTGCSWTSGCPPTSWIRRSGASPTATTRPLDMRMSQEGPSARDLVNTLGPAGAGGHHLPLWGGPQRPADRPGHCPGPGGGAH